ncbi:MAG: RDD family protein [Pseudomonadota bacterium]
MPNETGDAEITNLIDVSDIEPSFADNPQEPATERDEPKRHPKASSPRYDAGPAIASLKDRFAALLLDGVFLYIIYWIALISYRTIALGSAAGPIPASGANGIIFNGIFLLIALLWFVIPEMAFMGSPGKLLCNLTVRSVDGGYAGFVSVLLRNILRPIDMALAPLLIMTALMEWTGWHTRLGDIIGRTLVLKKLANPPRQHAMSLDIVASASERAVAFAIDTAMLAAFLLGYALLLNPDHPLVSMMLVVMAPAAILAFFAVPEWITKTSPGKWALGFTICHEDGSAIDLSSAVVRTVWRAFDTNPWGFLTSLFSVRRQRPGDSAAGTVVIKAPREWSGLAGLAAVLVISAAMLYAGLQNRDSFLGGSFQVNFLPSIDLSGPGASSRAAPTNLMTKNFSFAAGDPASTRSPSFFQPGEMLFIIFEVTGFKRDKNHVWLQEDLNIRYPDDSVGLKLENINDFNQYLVQEEPIRFENNITIPENAQSGRYTVTLTIRDKLSRQELKEQRFFYITPPASQTPQQVMPAPPTPPPPAPPGHYNNGE